MPHLDDIPNAMPPDELRRRLDYADAALLAECDVHLHRVGGPGGQHRNKVSSAVRLVHRPSGIVVTGTERRSQHENKANALARLREAIAVHARRPLPDEVAWPESVHIDGGHLRVSEKNAAYHHVIALVLDALTAYRGVHRDAARALHVTPTSLVRFLADCPRAWTEANRLRQECGLPPLRA